MTARAVQVETSPRERRVIRRVEARGEVGLDQALLALRGTVAAARYLLTRLYAVGGEGAVYECKDIQDPRGRRLVAKLPLHAYHRPARLCSDRIRAQRHALRIEASHLLVNCTQFMADGVGLFEFHNPLLDPCRGGAFMEPEPVLIMEKLAGHDLDRWLARAHRTAMPRELMRRTLDRVVVVLLQALTDLRGRGLIYADLRPGNIRMIGRPSRRIRLIDAGSLVTIDDDSGRFPHVPAYLPPELFARRVAGLPIRATDAVQAEMAGRTLFEVATGRVPRPGSSPDTYWLERSCVSAPVADVIGRLLDGRLTSAQAALGELARRARRRVRGGNSVHAPVQTAEHTNGQSNTTRRTGPAPGTATPRHGLAWSSASPPAPQPSAARRGLGVPGVVRRTVRRLLLRR